MTQALCDSNYQCENCFTVSIASNVKIATEKMETRLKIIV